MKKEEGVKCFLKYLQKIIDYDDYQINQSVFTSSSGASALKQKVLPQKLLGTFFSKFLLTFLKMVQEIGETEVISEKQLLCRLYALFHVGSGKKLVDNAQKFDKFLIKNLEEQIVAQEEAERD